MEVTQPLDHVTHAVIGGGKTIDFGISSSAEFFNILTSSLYTDQILAVVREVLCNAWDAHIAAGITDRPIKVTLDGENFVVRDFGYGIKHADIGPIYGTYGNSTKKQDGAQTGGFGLGCKAPFAYTEHFEVISDHAGTRTMYNMSRSNAVAKGKPGIIPIASFPTTESGLQVKIPIQVKDLRRFKDLIVRIIQNGEMRVELNGALMPVLPFSKATNGFMLLFDNPLGDNGTDRLLLRYGNVIYPIPNTPEVSPMYSSVHSYLSRFHSGFAYPYLVLQAPPDSISVTPSREALSMQEHTISTLKKLFKNFLTYVEGLEAVMLEEVREKTTKAIQEKQYNTFLNFEYWAFKQEGWEESPALVDLMGMARWLTSRMYPTDNPVFRHQDLKFRVETAAQYKVVDPHLAGTYLQAMPKKPQNQLINYRRGSKQGRTNWLHRRVLGKVMSKLLAADLDPSALYLLDSQDPQAYSTSGKAPLVNPKTSWGRHHFINLPYLRKAVVVTTAITSLSDRLRMYAYHNEGSPRDGLLCYYVRSRKAGAGSAAVQFFTKLGYEVIDLTKRHTWEEAPKPKEPRMKAQPYAGLPALTNIIRDNGNVRVQTYRDPEAVMLPTPELVTVISAHNPESNLDGFSTSATRAIVRQYGSRTGVAKDKTQAKRAHKNGAKDLIEVLEADMEAILLTSSGVKEYFAYDPRRVRALVYSNHRQIIDLIYGNEELRKEFGIKYNLTEQEHDLVRVFHHSHGLNQELYTKIRNYSESIPLATANHHISNMVNDNDLLSMLDIVFLKSGLLSPKRQAYIDILIKALKG